MDRGQPTPEADSRIIILSFVLDSWVARSCRYRLVPSEKALPPAILKPTHCPWVVYYKKSMQINYAGARMTGIMLHLMALNSPRHTLVISATRSSRRIQIRHRRAALDHRGEPRSPFGRVPSSYHPIVIQIPYHQGYSGNLKVDC